MSGELVVGRESSYTEERALNIGGYVLDSKKEKDEPGCADLATRPVSVTFYKNKSPFPKTS